MLRHPVVITTLEEDFRKLGLITEEEQKDESDEEKETPDTEDSHSQEEPDDLEWDDDGVEESSDDDRDLDDAAMAEAVEFRERFKAEWDRLGAEGVETITLDEDDMVELDGFAAETAELPVDVVDGETSEEDAFDDEGDDDIVGEGVTPFQTVTEALKSIQSILGGSKDKPPVIESLDKAIPAFATMALVAEQLHIFFSDRIPSEDTDDGISEAYIEMAESFKNIAKYSAGVVDTLQTEDPDTIDTNAVGVVFQENMTTVLQGLEAYTMVCESEELEDEGEEEDTEEQDEGNE